MIFENRTEVISLGLTTPARAVTYNYSGNQLSGISGGGLTTVNSYQYDGNGNATMDGRLGVAVSYNLLNLPSLIANSTVSIGYTYDATGRKLRKQNNPLGVTTDYVDGIQYTNGTIDFIQTEEGRALNSGGTYSYQYDLKDHLGNVRFSFGENPITHLLDTLQRDDYYSPVIVISAVFMNSPDRRRNRLCVRPKESCSCRDQQLSLQWQGTVPRASLCPKGTLWRDGKSLGNMIIIICLLLSAVFMSSAKPRLRGEVL